MCGSGVSYVYVDTERIDVDSEFGGYLGGGLDFELTSMIKPFAEVLYRYAELDSNRITGGDIEVSGITANVGIKFHFN